MSQEKTAWLRAWLSALYGKQVAFRYILGKKSESKSFVFLCAPIFWAPVIVLSSAKL